VIRLLRHPLGPRLYVLGRRVHEWQVGVVILVVAAAFWPAGLIEDLSATCLVLAGGWLVVKDWRDLFPSLRDTAAWRLGIHRRAARLRPRRRGDWLPAASAAVVALAGLVNVVSTVTPNIAARAHVLRSVEPAMTIPVFHALALPLSAALVLTSLYLVRRRRRAWQVAFSFLLLLGALDILKGLDAEEALLSWLVAGVLWWGRESFSVRHDPIRLRSALWKVPVVAGAAFAVAASVALIAAPGSGPLVISREALALLAWSSGPIPLGGEMSWLPVGVGLVSAAALVTGAYLVFRPLAAPRNLPDRELRRAAGDLVRRHGDDTLAYFKLRRDACYLFSSDRRAFVGYRVESGVLLVSGDPVGPDDALPGLVRDLCGVAEAHGLELAALGASARLLPLWRDAGLRALYIGDEAIIETRRFTLEGRAIRKVRQSVTRLEKAGYRAALVPADTLGAKTVEELERVSTLWRAGKPERGFTMAMDSLLDEGPGGAVVVLAQDRGGAVRGFLHFVPVPSRPAMSLSFMRREPSTPNGLTEFLVARAVELLRERGVEEISLNFAAFARLLHSPRNPTERLLGRLLSLANSHFQIESLYRFNAKFFPRWEPRYLVFERTRRLPRVGLAAMWVEGQLPKPQLPKPALRRSHSTPA